MKGKGESLFFADPAVFTFKENMRHQHHFESKYATTCFQFGGGKKKTLKTVESKYESASKKRYNETHEAN